MHDVALSLGSNSGNRFFYMSSMQQELLCLLDSATGMSDLFETFPVDVTDEQPWYLNRIIRGTYSSTAESLLDACLAIENRLGRTGKGCKTERTADIDILLFDCSVITTSLITVPHPALLLRRFCIEGLFQLMPDAIVATTGRTISDHYASMSESVREQPMKIIHL